MPWQVSSLLSSFFFFFFLFSFFFLLSLSFSLSSFFLSLFFSSFPSLSICFLQLFVCLNVVWCCVAASTGSWQHAISRKWPTGPKSWWKNPLSLSAPHNPWSFCSLLHPTFLFYILLLFYFFHSSP